METRPIEINIEDNYLFSRLVSLVDRDDFIQDMETIRKRKLKLKNLYDRKFVEELYKYHYGYSLNLITKDNFAVAVKSLTKKYKCPLISPVPIGSVMTNTIHEAGDLLYKYHRNHGYLMAVVYAILCGVVNNGDYTTNTFPLIINTETIKGPLFRSPFNYVAIAINPESSPDDVLSVFKRTYLAYFHKKTFPKVFKKERLRTANDTMSKIKDFRKWYWMNYKDNPNRLGYRKIANRMNYKLPMETVRSGIRSYSALLSTSI